MQTFANPLMNLGSSQPVPDVVQVFEGLRMFAQKEIQHRLTPEEQIGVRQGGAAAQKARQVIRELVERQRLVVQANPSLGNWPEGTDEEIGSRIYRVLYGLGPLEVLLEQPEIEDIAVNGPGEVWVRTSTGWSEIPTESGSDFTGTPEGLLFMFNQAISSSGRQAGPLKPIVDERLSGGHRINIITEPVAADGVSPLVVVRRHRPVAFTAQDFIGTPPSGTTNKQYSIIDAVDHWTPGSLLTPASLTFLQLAVLSGMNILVLGRTGVGKTAFLSMLGGMIPLDRRVVVIEDTRELRLRSGQKPGNCVYLTSVPERLEGGISVPMSQLVIAALRQRPDHLVVGEARGAEMWDLLNSMQTGHGGNLTSVHAISARQLVERIQFMVSLPPAEIKLSPVEAGKLAATSFQVIVTMKMDWNGRRFIQDISAFTGKMLGEAPEMETLFCGGQDEDYILKLTATETRLDDHLQLSGLSFEPVRQMARREAAILKKMGILIGKDRGMP